VSHLIFCQPQKKFFSSRHPAAIYVRIYHQRHCP